jgi:hypothetical protein
MFFFYKIAKNLSLDLDPHSFSKSWIWICMKWMQIRNLPSMMKFWGSISSSTP